MSAQLNLKTIGEINRTRSNCILAIAFAQLLCVAGQASGKNKAAPCTLSTWCVLATPRRKKRYNRSRESGVVAKDCWSQKPGRPTGNTPVF